MNKQIEIDGQQIGSEAELFIYSEIGVTCNFEVEKTKRLIDVTKDAGADAVKLSIKFADETFSKDYIEYEYETTEGSKTQNLVERTKDLTFTLDEWFEIKEYAEDRDLIWFASISTPTGIEWARKLDMPIIKISSWDYNNIPLWDSISQMDKPVFVDTGPAYLWEISNVQKIMLENYHKEWVLVHTYHTEDPCQMNMKSIPYLKQTFNCPAGFSSPNRTIDRDIIAVSLGADTMEKRLTLSRDTDEHHHVKSLEPDEFENYVNRIRDVESALGEETIKPSKGDLEERERWFRQVVANQDLKSGEKLTKKKIAVKRPPGDGVSPKYIDCLEGLKLNQNKKKDDPITWEDVK